MTDDAAHRFREFLVRVGIDLDGDPEMARTPERVTELYGELFSGLRSDPPELSVFTLPSEEVHGAVFLTALPFYSMCVHHLLPFFGAVDVAYLPGNRMVGFSSIGAVVDHFARRPQVQERMIVQIADYIDEALEPQALLVRLRARQLCMEMRGCQKTGELISLAQRGDLKPQTRSEFLTAFQRAERPL